MFTARMLPLFSRRSRRATAQLLAELVLAALVAVAFTIARAPAQTLDDASVAGAWRVVLAPDDPATAALPAPLKDKLTVYLSQSGGGLSGWACDKLGPCGKVEVPVSGVKAGANLQLDQSAAVPSPPACEVGPLTLDWTAVLEDNAHAIGTCTGSYAGDPQFAVLSFTAKLKRISGMQAPDDPDGDGPGLPLAELDGGSGGAHDLAVVAIKAPKFVKSKADLLGIQKDVSVRIQNRGQHDEVIPDGNTLAQLVTLQSEQISGSQGTVLIELRLPTAGSFPITLKPKKKLNVDFLVTFLNNSAGDAPGVDPDVISWTAAVHHEALPGSTADDHPEDDVCPRGVAPPYTFDSYPDGSIKEKGAGAKKPDGTLGAPVITKFAVVGGG
jgi:hypothetical protein